MSGLTVILMVDVALPAELLAVIIYAVETLASVGVPVIAPVVVFKTKPAGKGGDTE